MAYIPTGKELIDPFKVLAEAEIRTGMKLADFGCGTLGHYVFPAAHLVGAEGQVFAVDILKSVLNSIESRSKMEGTSNVTALWGDIERVNGVKIADNSLDIGLLINNLFMSKQKAAMVKECVRCVKPGGRFVIIEWLPVVVSFGPESASRVSPTEARQLAEAAGLKHEKDIVPGQFHYGFIFIK
ncbi:class I SAM-dependent methyltransferase [Patescibacteria group bacterium]|nr:class I SAM-dependent methyltransferase [Patescibacteria group bacterium]MBU1028705.1 class I SAM-dependent methyltransferase [Patescibacteria group bacterium]